jgi:predicted nucleic acid-binding protein
VITAVDTNVLLDVFLADPRFVTRSRDLLRRCAREGVIVACDIVWAEIGAHFDSSGASDRTLEDLGIAFSPLAPEAASFAGRRFREYRRRGGRRTRIVPDFLIGSHALHQADRLLSRDRGFYRTYFKRLSLLDPGEE